MNCFECGQPADHAHHVVPRSLGGTKTVPLCGGCHGKVHGLRIVSARALTKAALDKRKAEGKCVGSLPYGYRIGAGGKLWANTDERETAQEMMNLRDNGMSFRNISDALARRGMFNRKGQKFSPARICEWTNDWRASGLPWERAS